MNGFLRIFSFEEEELGDEEGGERVGDGTVKHYNAFSEETRKDVVGPFSSPLLETLSIYGGWTERLGRTVCSMTMGTRFLRCGVTENERQFVHFVEPRRKEEREVTFSRERNDDDDNIAFPKIPRKFNPCKNHT